MLREVSLFCSSSPSYHKSFVLQEMKIFKNDVIMYLLVFYLCMAWMG